MLIYYLDLALRSLRRSRVLTVLMVLSLALGIGACITTLTVLRLLSGDPMPGISASILHPQLDPRHRQGYQPGQSRPLPIMSYPDAMNLLHAGRARYQAALALTPAKIRGSDPQARPFFSNGVMTTAQFFPMFDVPFRFGSGWSAGDDIRASRVVVIADFLNDKLFGGANSVGRSLRIGGHDYRIIGVLGHWAPQPRFYALNLGGRGYGNGDAVFMPLSAARADHMNPQNINCQDAADLRHLEQTECQWLGLWVRLASPAQVPAYRRFLDNYVHQQMALGRLQRPDHDLPDLMTYLRQQHVVPDDVRLQAGVAFGFLLICVVNTVGLLLARCLRRSREIGVRRALGASRGAVFAQFLIEAAVIGLGGGLLGLGVAELGLWGIRQQPAEYASLAHLDLAMFVFTFVVALLASLVAGLLPAWRACLVAPAPQLKSS